MFDQDLPLPHRYHEEASAAMHGALVGPTNDAITILRNHFADNPHHRAAAMYSKKYLEANRTADELAVASHRHRDYEAAASQMDRGNDELAGLHDMMAYNVGIEHPTVKALGKIVDARREGTSSYRKTLGLHGSDTDQRFKEMTQNLNIGQQFDGLSGN